MKKKILLLFALIVSITGAYANNGTLSIQNIRNMIPGHTGSFDIVLSGSDNTYCAFQFNIAMPNGLTLIKYDTTNDIYAKNGPLLSNHTQSVTDHTTYWTFIIESSSTANFSAANGTLLTIYFSVDANASGTPEGSLSSIVMSDNQTNAYNLSEINYSVPVDNTLFLDENDDYTPEAFTGINVHVNRALKANTWSTIVHPFAMTAEQVTATFGEGVKIGKFTNMTLTWDTNEENVEGVTVNFAEQDAMDAHTPYIIKVPTAMLDGYTVSGVDLTEFTGTKIGTRVIYDDPAIINGQWKQGKYQFADDMVGTYKPITLNEGNLFLSDNVFKMSKGKSKLKAFRAYFSNENIYYDDGSSRSFIINFNDGSEPTGISTQKTATPSDCFYSLTGQLVKNPAKGIYINNGKKVIIK